MAGDRYNPHFPYLLGQEWVPIKNEEIDFIPATSVEYGYRFRYDGVATSGLTDGFPFAMFGIGPEAPFLQPNWQRGSYTVNLYREGDERRSGAVRQVTIPCMSISATGNTNPSFASMLEFQYTSDPPPTQVADFYFDVLPYKSLLYGKRILNVSFLYAGSTNDVVTGDNGIDREIPISYDPLYRQYFIEPLTKLAVTRSFASTSALNSGALYYLADNGPRGWGAMPGLIFQPSLDSSDPAAILRFDKPPITSLSLGNVVRTGDSTNSFNFGGEWSYDVLLKFNRNLGANGFGFRLYVQLPNTAGRSTLRRMPRLRLNYAALQVTFCNENRMAYCNPQPTGGSSVNANKVPMLYGIQQAQLQSSNWFWNDSMSVYDRFTFHRPGAWPKGNYVLTVSNADQGEDGGVRQRFTPLPVIATRGLYPNPSYPPVRIDVPYPASDPTIVEGKELTVNDESEIMPQMFLASGGSPWTTNVPTHAYSRQITAPVYGQFEVTQKLLVTSPELSGFAATNPSWNKIRFWARRFGQTSVPLRVSQAYDPGFWYSSIYEPAGLAYFKTPDDATLDIVGNLDIRADFTMYRPYPNPPASNHNYLIGKWGGTQNSYMLRVTDTGPTLDWSNDGTTILTAALTTPYEWNGSVTRTCLRATLTVNNGAGGNTTVFYTGPTLAGPWTPLGTVTQGGTTSIFSGTAELRAGDFLAGVQTVLHAAEVRNGIDGTVVASPQFDQLTVGTSAFVDGTGKTWSTAGSPATPLILDSSTIPFAEITPEAFDALDSITTDGWKQVDLDLSPAINLTFPVERNYLRWTAEGEWPGSRWEILAAAAYEVSGQVPGNWLLQDQIYPNNVNSTYGLAATYTYGGYTDVHISRTERLYPEPGVWLTTQGPWVSGYGPDIRADACFILAQTAPSVTGLTVANSLQSLGISQVCSANPSGIPTSLQYLGLSWNPPANSGRAKDTFSRTLPCSWGTPNFGPAWTPQAETFLKLDGSNGNFASTPDNAALDITGDIDIRADIKMNAWGVGAGVQNIVSKYVSAGQRSYLFYLTTGGLLGLATSNDGTALPVNAVSTTAPVPVNGRLSIRATLDVDNGAGQKVVTFFTSTDTNLSTASWTVLGSAVTTATITSIFNSTSNVEVGSANNGTTNNLNSQMQIYSAQIRNGIAGAIVANPLFNAQAVGTTTFTDSATRVWTINGTTTGASVCSALSVANGFGYIDTAYAPSTVQGGFLTTGTGPDFDARVTMRNQRQIAELETAVNFRIYGRYTDANNYYWVQVSLAPAITGTVSVINDAVQQGLFITLGKTVAGVQTILDQRQAATFPQGTGEGAGLTLRFSIMRNMLKVKYWDLQGVESPVWFMEVEDNNLISGDGFALLGDHAQGQALIAYSDLELTPPQFWFDSTEIQRMDTEETTWKTIMKATNPAVTSFNDYEARAGIVSQYRIRQSYVYGFAGPWSTAVSGMVPDPGVLGTNVNGHLLMFTTNERQTGSGNAAYASVWENGNVTEEFTFPESNLVQLQLMYNKDFYTAFRPLERGGEQFTRQVLVQAMALDPTVMANFTSLRDLAWDSVNYVCVRDEDGNRWLATVQVPTGRVQRRRTIYIAEVQVTETTETPTPVDPAWAP